MHVLTTALVLSIEWLPRMHVLTTALAPSHSQVRQALALSIEWLEDMLWHGSRVQLAGGIQ
jgi:hypothetical protein